MNCKDCIYFKRCVVLGVELDMNHDKEADKNCRYFSNKSDFVKIVRCGECERRSKGADLTNTIYCPWLKRQFDKTDYCSYGERRCNK